MAYDTDRWAILERELVPFKIKIREHSIPPFKGRFVHVLTIIAMEMDDPHEVIPYGIRSSWVGDFIKSEDVVEMQVVSHRDPFTLDRRVRVALFLTREQEFILRLQHSHELPDPRSI